MRGEAAVLGSPTSLDTLFVVLGSPASLGSLFLVLGAWFLVRGARGGAVVLGSLL